MTSYPAGTVIGETKCHSPVCGGRVQITIGKRGSAYYVCPHCDPETLKPCYSKMFYGKDATSRLIAKFENEKAVKNSRDDTPKKSAPIEAETTTETSGAPYNKIEEVSDEGVCF